MRDRCNPGEVSEHGLASARGRLAARLGRLIDAPPPLEDAERFAKHLANEFPVVFLFLCDPSIDATNWRAEQAIRPAGVTRKVCGGNGSAAPHFPPYSLPGDALIEDDDSPLVPGHARGGAARQRWLHAAPALGLGSGLAPSPSRAARPRVVERDRGICAVFTVPSCVFL